MPKSQRLAPFEVPAKPGGGLTFATPRQNPADYFFITKYYAIIGLSPNAPLSRKLQIYK
ncbi:MAG: hypothetical protein V1649_04330 [Patescibacteria group bacterium]